MISSSSRNLISYWLETRGANLIPKSSDIRLEDLEGGLSRTLYCEWEGRDRVIIRFSGSEVAMALGNDFVGRDFLDLSHPKLRETSRLFLEAVCFHPCIAISILTLRGQSGAPREFEFVYLPIEHGGGRKRLLAMAHPLTIDYRLSDIEGATQALRYQEPTFVDVGAGTPPIEGQLSGIAITSLEELDFPD